MGGNVEPNLHRGSETLLIYCVLVLHVGDLLCTCTTCGDQLNFYYMKLSAQECSTRA